MRRIFFAVTALSLMCVSASASAEDKHPFRVGFGMDVGVPSGAAVGLVVHPKTDVLSLQLSVTYNALNLGERLSVKVDPFGLLPNCPIGLFVDVQGGWALNGTIPGHSELPGIGYHYANFYGGLRFGKPNGFHWNLEVGPTYMQVNTSGFQDALNSLSAPKGLTIGNPTVTGWVMPTFVTGFEVVWP